MQIARLCASVQTQMALVSQIQSYFPRRNQLLVD